jgi:hypothetical protein
MYRHALLLLPLTLALPGGAGGDKFDPEARARALAPYLDEQTLAVLRIDLSRPDAEAVALKIAEFTWAPGDAVDRKPQVRKWIADFTRAGGKEIYFLFAVGDLFEAPLIVAPLDPGAKSKEIAALLGSGRFVPRGQYEQLKGAVVGGNPEGRERLRTLKPEPRPDLARALAAAGDSAAQFLVLPTDDMRRVLEEIMPRLPKELASGSSTILTHGVRWAAVGLQGAPKLEFKIVVQSKDNLAARRLRTWLGEALFFLKDNKEVRRIFPEFEKVAALLKPVVEKDRLTLTLKGEDAARLLQPLIGESRLTTARQQSLNNLQQIAIAVITYADNHQRALPVSATSDRKGKPLLSWRVQILPYLGEKALYKEFHLDEPWDSPHNKKLLARMPKVYRSPFVPEGEQGKTTYLAPVGKETAFPPGRGVLFPKEFTDGTSNTILIVEAAAPRAVYWTSPEDWRFDAKDVVPGLIGKKRQEFLVALADSAVRAIPVSLGLDNIRALFTRNGGEVIGKEF